MELDDQAVSGDDNTRKNSTYCTQSRLREKAIMNLLQEATLEKAAAATGVSVRTQIVDDSEVSPSARVAAIRVTLEIAQRDREDSDLAARIRKLEERFHEK